MSSSNDAALVESILYLNVDPLDETEISRISLLPIDLVIKALERLNEHYQVPESGLTLSKTISGWVIFPKKELWGFLKNHYGKRNSSRLSKAALETLSIIAYSQPVTRAEIEVIRGVSADGMIRTLLDSGLIKEIGRKSIPGRPIQYGTTKEFLSYFKLASIADLPKLDESDNERFELTSE